jgi:hypothetical protein
MTQLLEKYKAYLPADTGTYSSAEAKRAAMKRDKEHVKLLIDHLRERMTDPFEVEGHPEALINISTRMHASLEIEIILEGDFITRKIRILFLFVFRGTL